MRYLGSGIGSTMHGGPNGGPGNFGVHAAQRLVVRLGESAPASGALKAAQSVAVLAEFPAFDSAVVTCHSDLAFRGQVRQNDCGCRNPAFGANPRLSLAGSSNYQRGAWLLRCPSLRRPPARHQLADPFVRGLARPQLDFPYFRLHYPSASCRGTPSGLAASTESVCRFDKREGQSAFCAKRSA